MTTLEVALCQYGLGTADSMAQLQTTVENLFERAGNADLYVLPELFLSDLRLEDEDTPLERTVLTSEEQSTYHEFVKSAAKERDAVIVAGSYNVADDGDVYNRMPIATPESFELYDKRHPTPGERESGKTAGVEAPPIVNHQDTKIGVLNCYDIEFPELTRELVDRGAEVIANPSWTGSDAGYQRISQCGAARAIENQCYVASVPLVGSRGDCQGTGRAAIFSPCDDIHGAHGTRLRLPRDEPAAATCPVDIAALRASRQEAEVRPYSDYLEGK